MLLATEPHGEGEICATQRDLKEGEVAEWILLDGVRSVSFSLGTAFTPSDGVGWRGLTSLRHPVPILSFLVLDAGNLHQYIAVQSLP